MTPPIDIPKNSFLVFITLLFPINLNCDVLGYLVPFIQFKKREKHPWKSVTFSKVAG